MKELETLLTSLVQRGRKPWGLRYFAEVMVFKTYIDFITKKWASSPTSLRELVSLESGLWQFVVKNNLQWEWKEWTFNISFWPEGPDAGASFYCGTPEYRLLESALIPEEELGKFLLSNIVIEWNSKYETK